MLFYSLLTSLLFLSPLQQNQPLFLGLKYYESPFSILPSLSDKHRSFMLDGHLPFVVSCLLELHHTSNLLASLAYQLKTSGLSCSSSFQIFFPMHFSCSRHTWSLPETLRRIIPIHSTFLQSHSCAPPAFEPPWSSRLIFKI